MKIKIGDELDAAIGTSVRHYTVRRIFNDGVSTWVEMVDANGMTTTTTTTNLRDGIERTHRTDLKETEI